MVKPIVDRVLSAKGRLLLQQRELEEALCTTVTALIALYEDVSVVDSAMGVTRWPDQGDMHQLEAILQRYQLPIMELSVY